MPDDDDAGDGAAEDAELMEAGQSRHVATPLTIYGQDERVKLGWRARGGTPGERWSHVEVLLRHI